MYNMKVDLNADLGESFETTNAVWMRKSYNMFRP